MKVMAGNGCRWRIGRRRTPWRLRGEWVVDFLLDTRGDTDDAFGVINMVLFVPVLVVFLVGWLLGVLLTPFVAFARAVGMANTVVVAYPLDADERVPIEWKLATDAGTADGILRRLPQELRAYGVPRSLPPPAASWRWFECV